ncbi:MAG: serine hydrolase [Gemmatimonadaceae bacterium]|nr:serine hydrolase [Gemmatimonadaceae bacterium]
MKYTLTLVALLAPQCVLGQGEGAARPARAASTSALTRTEIAAVDAIFRQAYPADAPGATVLIARGDDVLYRKAFGMADLELRVPMRADNVLQLASITKQFTSVSILMLMEQGKLALQDPLSKFIPDYPRGDEITLHHLLNHSSGVTSYTNLVTFRSKTRQDLSPEEIVESVKHLPLEFTPGTQYAYSNSGYALLGMIIEKLSGVSYGEFVRKNIFDRLGMKHSYYASNFTVIPSRASGYQLYEGNVENPEYMSPTVAYAAGALLSNVDDMLLWSRSLRRNTLVSESAKHLAFTNHRLSTGRLSNYGYGWAINELAGVPTLEHTGGINGYATSGIYVPGRDVYAIVLTNRDDGRGPESYNLKAVSMLLGQSIVEKAAVALSEAQLRRWVGAYQFDDVVRFVTYDQGALYSTREGGRPIRLLAVSDSQFRFEGSLATYGFSLKDGKRQVLYLERISRSVGHETDKKPAAEREAITLAPEILARYVGVYELQPSFLIEVKSQNGVLIATATGSPPVELLAEAEDRFFIREIGAQVTFNLGSNGAVQSLTFLQGGNRTEGRKVR